MVDFYLQNEFERVNDVPASWAGVQDRQFFDISHWRKRKRLKFRETVRILQGHESNTFRVRKRYA